MPHDLLRKEYSGTLLAAGGFTKETGNAILAAGRADRVVFGRPFIANPDHVERFRKDKRLNERDDVSSFLGRFGLVALATLCCHNTTFVQRSGSFY